MSHWRVLSASILLGLTYSEGLSASGIDRRLPRAFSENVVARLEGLKSQDGDCRAQIARFTCLAEREPDHEHGIPAKCVAGVEPYVQAFQNLYDKYPMPIQKMFCSLSGIYIVKDFNGTAMASPIMDSNRRYISGEVYVRQSAVDAQLDLSTWASWKDQLSFGGYKDSYKLKETLPKVRASLTPQVDFLYFVIAHEFGHLFDWFNYVNSSPTPPTEGDGLPPNSWGLLSWLSWSKPRPEADFSHRSELCFYSCEKTIPEELVSEIYDSFSRSPFISLYAAGSEPGNDFADSVAYYVMATSLHGTYQLDVANGRTYDIFEKYHSEVFRTKREFLEKFMNGPIWYP